MPQTVIHTRDSGLTEEKGRVTVENISSNRIDWDCINYSGDGNTVNFTLNPGEKDDYDYDYARRTFGDWELSPDGSPEDKVAWNNMIGYTRRRSPSGDGMLPQVRVYNRDGDVLWDSKAQMQKWLEVNKNNPKAFSPDATAPSPLGNAPMPEILKNANKEQLQALYEESWGFKMPQGISHDNARKQIFSRLTEAQLQDVIAKEYEAARESETTK